MHFRLSKIIGNGRDAEDNARRPSLSNAGDIFSTCYGASHVLCATIDEPPASPHWAALESVNWKLHGVSVDDLSNGDDIADRVARRFLTRQLLAGDDFGDLNTKLDRISANKRARMRSKLGVDFSDIEGSMTVDEALGRLLPRVKMRHFGSKSKGPSPPGSFTDDFNRSDEDLGDSADWSPIGGTSAGACAVRSNQLAFLSGFDGGFLAPDQGSANHYGQIVVRATSTGRNYFPICNRMTDEDNYVGGRARNASSEEFGVFTKISGSFTEIVKTTAVNASVGAVFRLESDGNDHEMFVDEVSRGTAVSAFNNTVTRQGCNPRSNTANPAVDDFEIGVISSGGVPFPAELLSRRQNTLVRM